MSLFNHAAVEILKPVPADTSGHPSFAISCICKPPMVCGLAAKTARSKCVANDNRFEFITSIYVTAKQISQPSLIAFDSSGLGFC